MRPLLFALVAGASLAVAGCQRPHPTATKTPPTEAAPVTLSLIAAAPPAVDLPPAPVPATFDVAELAERVKPMVVNITTTHEVEGRQAGGADPFEYFFGQRSPNGPRQPGRGMKQSALGTGFIIDAEGYVVTNEHVIREADEVRVRLADDHEYPADIVGRDPKLDVALLKIKGAATLPAARLGSSDALRVGEHVLAVGNPFGLGHTVTLGIVSAKARSIGAGPYDDFIQTDASINPGNSGGPLFNWRGDVIGINTAIRQGANGIGFAIPIDALKDVLGQLRDKGYVERGKLGLAFQPMTDDLAKALGLPSQTGALVAEVEPGGSAARAGVLPGDVILSVNGTVIHHAEELPRNIARNPPGAEIGVTLLRGGQERQLRAKLDLLQDEAARPPSRPARAEQPKGQSADKLGIEVSDAPGGGVRIDDVLAGSAATELQRGDVIVAMNGAPVTGTASLQAAMAKAKPGSIALIQVKRGDRTQFAAVPLPKK